MRHDDYLAIDNAFNEIGIVQMSPKEYYEEIVTPTVADFRAQPTSRRFAYNACQCLWHFADAASKHSGRSLGAIRAEISAGASCFEDVGDIANLSKHFVLEPSRYKRPVPKIEDAHVGRAAAFSDGTFWVDLDGSQHSWSDAIDVFRTKNAYGQLIDVLWCVDECDRVVQVYLKRPDMS